MSCEKRTAQLVHQSKKNCRSEPYKPTSCFPINPNKYPQYQKHWSKLSGDTYLEVGRVHTQSEGMQLTEGQQTICQVVDFAYSIGNSAHQGLSMLLHRARVGAQVFPVGEVNFGLWVRHQEPIWEGTSRSKLYIENNQKPF